MMELPGAPSAIRSPESPLNAFAPKNSHDNNDWNTCYGPGRRLLVRNDRRVGAGAVEISRLVGSMAARSRDGERLGSNQRAGPWPGGAAHSGVQGQVRCFPG